MSGREIEERPGSPGARQALGGVGGQVGARMSRREVEERPGSPGARRALGGVGGQVGAPHVK